MDRKFWMFCDEGLVKVISFFLCLNSKYRIFFVRFFMLLFISVLMIIVGFFFCFFNFLIVFYMYFMWFLIVLNNMFEYWIVNIF